MIDPKSPVVEDASFPTPASLSQRVNRLERALVYGAGEGLLDAVRADLSRHDKLVEGMRKGKFRGRYTVEEVQAARAELRREPEGQTVGGGTEVEAMRRGYEPAPVEAPKPSRALEPNTRELLAAEWSCLPKMHGGSDAMWLDALVFCGIYGGTLYGRNWNGLVGVAMLTEAPQSLVDRTQEWVLDEQTMLVELKAMGCAVRPHASGKLVIECPEACVERARRLVIARRRSYIITTPGVSGPVSLPVPPAPAAPSVPGPVAQSVARADRTPMPKQDATGMWSFDGKGPPPAEPRIGDVVRERPELGLRLVITGKNSNGTFEATWERVPADTQTVSDPEPWARWEKDGSWSCGSRNYAATVERCGCGCPRPADTLESLAQAMLAEHADGIKGLSGSRVYRYSIEELRNILEHWRRNGDRFGGIAQWKCADRIHAWFKAGGPDAAPKGPVFAGTDFGGLEIRAYQDTVQALTDAVARAEKAERDLNVAKDRIAKVEAVAFTWQHAARVAGRRAHNLRTACDALKDLRDEAIEERDEARRERDDAHSQLRIVKQERDGLAAVAVPQPGADEAQKDLHRSIRGVAADVKRGSHADIFHGDLFEYIADDVNQSVFKGRLTTPGEVEQVLRATPGLRAWLKSVTTGDQEVSGPEHLWRFERSCPCKRCNAHFASLVNGPAVPEPPAAPIPAPRAELLERCTKAVLAADDNSGRTTIGDARARAIALAVLTTVREGDPSRKCPHGILWVYACDECPDGMEPEPKPRVFAAQPAPGALEAKVEHQRVEIIGLATSISRHKQREAELAAERDAWRKRAEAAERLTVPTVKRPTTGINTTMWGISVDDHKWHRYMIASDIPGGTNSLYVDGKLQASTPTGFYVDGKRAQPSPVSASVDTLDSLATEWRKVCGPGQWAIWLERNARGDAGEFAPRAFATHEAQLGRIVPPDLIDRTEAWIERQIAARIVDALTPSPRANGALTRSEHLRVTDLADMDSIRQRLTERTSDAEARAQTLEQQLAERTRELVAAQGARLKTAERLEAELKAAQADRDASRSDRVRAEQATSEARDELELTRKNCGHYMTERDSARTDANHLLSRAEKAEQQLANANELLAARERDLVEARSFVTDTTTGGRWVPYEDHAAMTMERDDALVQLKAAQAERDVETKRAAADSDRDRESLKYLRGRLDGEIERADAAEAQVKALASVFSSKPAVEHTERARQMLNGVLCDSNARPAEIEALAIAFAEVARSAAEPEKVRADGYWKQLCDTMEAMGLLVPETVPYSVTWAKKTREKLETAREELAQAKSHVSNLRDELAAAHRAENERFDKLFAETVKQSEERDRLQAELAQAKGIASAALDTDYDRDAKQDDVRVGVRLQNMLIALQQIVLKGGAK